MTPLTALALLVACTGLGQDRLGFVHGKVVDLHGAVIVNALVAVESLGNQCQTKTDGRGEFTCKLPAGQYRISATSYDFLPYQRAPITIRPNDHVFLTLSAVPGPERGLTVDERGAKEFIGAPIPVQHYSETISDRSVLIRFTTREQSRFRGPYLMLTSESLSVYADELSCTVPIRTCSATGNIRIEIGQETLDGTSVELDLTNRKFKLTRNATVSHDF